MLRAIFLSLFSLMLAACATGGGNLPVASRIVVYKSEREMALLDQSGQPFRTYKIAMGENPVGPKECEGDERTPEGTYMIENHNPDSHYHLSLKISYPSPDDVKRAEALGESPGGDIFIHGVPNREGPIGAFMYRFKPSWTNGCIAVDNSDMDEIWTHVADGTPIEIRP